MNLNNTKAHKPNEGQEYSSIFDGYYPYSKIGRVVVDNNTGAIKRFLSFEDSNFTTLGEPINLDTNTESIMVYYPPFYRKKDCRVGGVEKQGIALNVVPDRNGTNCPKGYVIEDWFLEEDGTIAEYRLLGAFNGYDQSGQLVSLPNVIPTRNLNIQQFRDKAKHNRVASKSGLFSFYAVSAVQRLFIMEFGNFDSQTTLGKGNTEWSFSDGADSAYEIIRTGSTMLLGNKSGYLNKTYEGNEITNGKVSISYRGLEDFYSNVWQFIDGIITIDTGYYFTNSFDKMNQIKSDNVLNTQGWINYVTTVPTSNGYISQMYGGTMDFSFFPEGTNGGSSTYYCDYRYSYNGVGVLRVGVFGGSWAEYYGSRTGAFFWNLNHSASAVISNIGSRLELRK